MSSKRSRLQCLEVLKEHLLVAAVLANIKLSYLVPVKASRAGHSHFVEAALFNQGQVLHWQSDRFPGVSPMGGAASTT